MKAKYHQFISKIIINEQNTIDWGRAMHLIDILKQNRKSDKEIFDSIKDIVSKGNRKVKMDSALLVDALFKNGTPSSLKVLQNYVPKIFPINDYSQDVSIHRFFCQLVQTWSQICKQNNCLNQNFVKWNQNLFSFRYVYIMTPEMMKKFSKDFHTTREFLNLFKNELINAKNNGKDWDDLNEMNINVVDVHQRLTALECTSTDRNFISIIRYLEDYCCVCTQAYESLKKNGTFEEEILLEMESQGMTGRKENKPKNSNAYLQFYSNNFQSNPNYELQQERPKSQDYTNFQQERPKSQGYNNYQKPIISNSNENFYEQPQMNQFFMHSQPQIENQQIPQPLAQQTQIQQPQKQQSQIPQPLTQQPQIQQSQIENQQMQNMYPLIQPMAQQTQIQQPQKQQSQKPQPLTQQPQIQQSQIENQQMQNMYPSIQPITQQTQIQQPQMQQSQIENQQMQNMYPSIQPIFMPSDQIPQSMNNSPAQYPVMNPLPNGYNPYLEVQELTTIDDTQVNNQKKANDELPSDTLPPFAPPPFAPPPYAPPPSSYY